MEESIHTIVLMHSSKPVNSFHKGTKLHILQLSHMPEIQISKVQISTTTTATATNNKKN